MANHGDTLKVILDYIVDGAPLAESNCDEIEFSIGSKRYTLTGGTVVLDPGTNFYTVALSQEDTFALKDANKYQLRVKKGTSVGSSPALTMVFGGTISTTKL